MNKKISLSFNIFVKHRHKLQNEKNGESTKILDPFYIEVNKGKVLYNPKFCSFSNVIIQHVRKLEKHGNSLVENKLKHFEGTCLYVKGKDNLYDKPNGSTEDSFSSLSQIKELKRKCYWLYLNRDEINNLLYLQKKCYYSSKTKEGETYKKKNCDNINKKVELGNIKKKVNEKNNNIVPFYEIIKKHWESYFLLARIHIPTGFYLLFYSSLYAYILTYNVNELFHNNSLNINKLNDTIKHIGLILFGSINTRIAGCIANDLWDRNIDKLVERTKTRPLANGSMNVKTAFFYFFLHGCLSLWTLFQFNYQTIYIGLSSIFLIITYPLLKRVTYYSQVYLSLTFNMGFFIVSSINTNIFQNFFPFFIGFLPLSFLTIIYDTIYAHQDKQFDKKLNLKSMALKWGNKTLMYSKMLSITMIPLFYWTGVLFDMHSSFSIFSIFNVLYLYQQIKNTSLDDQEKCMKFFKNNKNMLLLITLSAFLAKLMELLQIKKNEIEKEKEKEKEIEKEEKEKEEEP